MQPTEVVLAILFLIFLVVLFPNSSIRDSKPLGIWIFVVPLVLHLFIDGYRWQMVPFYLLIILVYVLQFRSRGIGCLGTIMLSLVFLAVIQLPRLFPVFAFPEPTGDYQVGSVSFALEDADRPETFTDDPTDVRKIFVQVWYPATGIENSELLPYWSDTRLIGGQLARGSGLPNFVFNHFNRVETNSFDGAEMNRSDIPLPVLVFSHGYGSLANQNMAQMEGLASHGYVVYAIGHSYESAVVVFEDGAAILQDEASFGRFNAEADATLPLLEKFDLALEAATQAQIVGEINAASPELIRLIGVRSADIDTLISYLENPTQADAFLKGSLDLNRLGIFGMSLGGATAAQFCHVDSRCKASVNLDGFPYGVDPEAHFTKPYLSMSSGPFPQTNRFLLERSNGQSQRLTVATSEHFNYSDFNFVSPLLKSPLVGLLGEIDGVTMNQIINWELVGFFDANVKNDPSVSR